MKETLVVCFVCLTAAAQQQPAFEVASIKSSNYQGGPLRVTSRVDADGINFSNVTPSMCIQRAYEVKPYQVAGPAWINTERYMIVAKAAGAVPQDKILLMLQALLAERFKLAFHRESKEMPVYALVLAKNGPKFKESRDEGATEIGAGDGDGVNFQRASMQALVGVLARSLDRPVLNETGLKGMYDFRLVWDQEGSRPRPATSDAVDGPSVFAALQEQLGLKLESRRAPVEVLVVDHVEKPAEN